MSVTYGFYDSRDHDRTYSAEQLSSIFDGVIEDGILLAEGDCLEVTPGTGLNVIVGTGRAWFEHTWTKNDPALILPLAAAPADLDRIDTIVLTTNSDVEARVNEIKVMTGAPSNYPVAPTLIDTTKLHYHPLANVRVRASATSIAAANISDLRGTERTPWAKGGKYNDEIIAEEYDQAIQYSIGDSVMYKGELYRCVEDVTPGPIDLTKWDHVTVMHEVNRSIIPYTNAVVKSFEPRAGFSPSVPPTGNIAGVNYACDHFIALGADGKIYYSYDASKWRNGDTAGNNALYDACYGGGKFVVAGEDGLYVSWDGINDWKRTSMDHPSYRIEYGAGAFVVVSSHGIFYSPDLNVWIQRNMPNAMDAHDVCYGDGKFVVVGNAGGSPGNIAYSYDGKTWTRADGNIQERLVSVTYGNKRFVALSSIGHTFYSSNGNTWTQSNNSPAEQDGDVYCATAHDICYAYGCFIVVDNDGQISFSHDGINWKSTFTMNPDNTHMRGKGIACGGGKIVELDLVDNGDITWFRADTYIKVEDLGPLLSDILHRLETL